jgi:hypothetical protein
MGFPSLGPQGLYITDRVAGYITIFCVEKVGMIMDGM